MSNKCKIIKDILPLYVENMVGADTREFVREHLEHCAECHAEFEHMQKPAEFIPDTDIAPLKRIKKKLFIRRLQTIFFTAMLVCIMVVTVFAILTSPNYFPYTENLVNVIDNPNGDIIITFDDKVTGYSCIKEFDGKTEVYRINAWNTTWDLFLSNRGKENMVISPDTETIIRIFYAQNDGSEDILIYGLNANADEGIVTLPRLVLMPYFLLAVIVFVILAIVRFLLRNKSEMIVWIDRAILLPISYMAAHLCTKGICFTTYSSQRDFCIIIFVTILFYFAMLTGKILYSSKKENSKKGGRAK